MDQRCTGPSCAHRSQESVASHSPSASTFFFLHPRIFRLGLVAGIFIAAAGLTSDRRERAEEADSATIAPAKGLPFHELEAVLPQMLELESIASTDPDMEGIRIRIKPLIDLDVRLVIETTRKIRSRPGTRGSNRISIRKNKGEVIEDFDIETDGSNNVPVRVGLLVEDEAGNVTMSIHRQIKIAPAPLRNATRPEARTPSAIKTDQDGRKTHTFFPTAPKPLVTGRNK